MLISVHAAGNIAFRAASPINPTKPIRSAHWASAGTPLRHRFGENPASLAAGHALIAHFRPCGREYRLSSGIAY